MNKKILLGISVGLFAMVVTTMAVTNRASINPTKLSATSDYSTTFNSDNTPAELTTSYQDFTSGIVKSMGGGIMLPLHS